MAAHALETVTIDQLKAGDRIVMTYTHGTTGKPIKVRLTGTVESFTTNFILLKDIKRVAQHTNFSDDFTRPTYRILAEDTPGTLIRRYPRKG